MRQLRTRFKIVTVAVKRITQNDRERVGEGACGGSTQSPGAGALVSLHLTLLRTQEH